jgi:hypothetical protein
VGIGLLSICLNQVHSLIDQIGKISIGKRNTFNKTKSKKDKTDENRENRKPTCLKTDLWSVLGLLKTDRFWFRFRFRFLAGLYW